MGIGGAKEFPQDTFVPEGLIPAEHSEKGPVIIIDYGCQIGNQPAA
jgi:hypothetical protein